MSATILEDLEQRLLGSLRSSDLNGDDSSMQRLAILALLIKSKPQESGDEGNASHPRSGGRFSSLHFVATHEYFDGKALKILDFAVLNLIMAFSDRERARNIKYVLQVIEAVQLGVRRIWLQKKAPTLRKVCEKVLRPAAASDLRYVVSIIVTEP